MTALTGVEGAEDMSAQDMRAQDMSADAGGAAVPGAPPGAWEAARTYLALGWKLFVMPRRLADRKIPAGLCDACVNAGPTHSMEACACLLCHGFYAATADPDRLAAMWEVLPGGHLVVRTGAASGITVLDAEAHADSDEAPTGIEVLDAWEEYTATAWDADAHGGAGGWAGGFALPATARARSASGGVHLYYATGDDERIGSVNRVLPGVDVKSRGGYVLVPMGEQNAAAGGRQWLDDVSALAPPGDALSAWLRSTRRARGYGGGDGTGNGHGISNLSEEQRADFLRHLVDNDPPRGVQQEFLNWWMFRLVKLGGIADADALTGLVWPRVREWDQIRTDPWRRDHVERHARYVLRNVEPGAPVFVPDRLPRLEGIREDADARADAQDIPCPDTDDVPDTDVASSPVAETALVREGDGLSSIGPDGVARPVAMAGEARVIPVDFGAPEQSPGHGRTQGARGGNGGTEGGSVGYRGRGTDGDPSTEGMHDTGNGNRLIRLHGRDMRWLADEGVWLVWEGHGWRRDDRLTVDGWTVEVMTDVHHHASRVLEAEGEKAAKPWFEHMRASYGTGRRRAMETAARSVPGMAVTSAMLDANSHQLVVKNGVVDLVTGTLMEGQRDALNTLCAGVAYDASATCPTWERHVDRITCGDAELARYLRRLAGYSLTGLTSEQVFFSLEGTGANGKNAFVEPLMMVMGDYAGAVDSKLITAGDRTHAAIIADLVGKRLVFVDEVPAKRSLDAERVKSLAGGREMKAQFMAKNWFSFTPRAKLWIAGNAQPPIQDASDGMWRRMHRVMFRAKITDEERVKGFSDYVFDLEGPGILNWCLKGLADWHARGGLGTPVTVADATGTLRDDSDHVRGFAGQCLEVTGWVRKKAANRLDVLEEGDWIDNASLHRVYAAWCDGQGVAPKQRHSAAALRRRLAEYEGVEAYEDRRKGPKTYGVEGVKLVVTAMALYSAGL
jgi:P4 family phage/plasmid primase-like protien